MFKNIQSACLSGTQSLAVEVEVSATTGLPQETIIGLPDTVIKESRARIKSAILLAGFEFPAMSYIINLAPTDILKRNISLELAMCVAILQVTNQICINEKYCFIGGISLDGRITPVQQLLPIIYYYPNYLNTTFVISTKNESDITPLDGINYITIDSINELKTLENKQIQEIVFSAPYKQNTSITFDDVKGHALAKKACTYSIIGRHPLLFIGPPGIGKTMLIERIPSLLPPLNHEEALKNYCLSLLTNEQATYETKPPFRAPHHSISYAGMIGGKNPPEPGEISRANYGILFLDEIGEYQRHILDTLREPLETKEISLSRAGASMVFPADFLLITAMNPCYCGHYFNQASICQCLPSQIKKYWQKISQPFLDRISICYILNQPDENAMTISQADMKSMIDTGISKIKSRNPGQRPNNELELDEIYQISCISNKTQLLLDQFFEKTNASMRGKRRTLQLSRTIADANNNDQICCKSVSLAIQLSQHNQRP
ncbi:MAG: YifB family Mg chelatase-like AAA ATPase [Candidatus Margulisiibacteriota bacterium]|nr:YifB family Mg chelatase-like AAA ATPase [Candidatus Margulisiibacteriota bacterium]